MTQSNAKEIVIEEAKELAGKLQNGKAGDPETQGRAIGLLVKMVTPLYAADFVTSEDCRKSHERLTQDECRKSHEKLVTRDEFQKTIDTMASANKIQSKSIKLNFGSFGFEGNLTPAIALALTAIGSIAAVILIVWKS